MHGANNIKTNQNYKSYNMLILIIFKFNIKREELYLLKPQDIIKWAEHPNVIWEVYGNMHKITSTYELWSIFVLP